jgi:hypothetical protein
VNDGVLVFQRRGASDANAAAAPPAAAGGGRRARANTDDTVDSDEEYVELRFARGHEVEMTTTTAPTTMNTTATSVDLLGSTTAAAAVRRDDDFTITDATSDEDDFVGSPTAPPKPGARGDTEDIPPPPTVNGESSSFAPVGLYRAEEEEEETRPPPPTPTPSQERSNPAANNRSMEFRGSHVITLILAASSFLFLLFFFDLHKIVVVMYGLLGSLALSSIVVLPLYEKMSSKFLGRGAYNKLHSPAPRWLRPRGMRLIDVASSASSLLLGIAWISVGFTLVQPMDSAYYWILQDVMGVCLCVMVLGLIHIRTIMVATIVLTLVFVYDVFFVLISPYIFGTSVMVSVAAGGSSAVDPSFCYKYPTDPRCRGSLAPLPMLLVRGCNMVFFDL